MARIANPIEFCVNACHELCSDALALTPSPSPAGRGVRDSAAEGYMSPICVILNRLGETLAQGPRQVDDRIGRSAGAGSAICHFVDEAHDRALLRQ